MVECSSVHFVSVFCVKMISLSIRQSAKCWILKIINVDRVINSDNGAVYRFLSDSTMRLNFLECKLCFCDDHVKRKGVKYNRGDPYPCPKCGFTCRETKDLSMSTRSYKFGRKANVEK